MAGKGGFFGVERVDWFNGGLFADADALVLTRGAVPSSTANCCHSAAMGKEKPPRVIPWGLFNVRGNW